jgi:hypothetical protein
MRDFDERDRAEAEAMDGIEARRARWTAEDEADYQEWVKPLREAHRPKVVDPPPF